jgi:flagellar biosynthetic protein FliR
MTELLALSLPRLEVFVLALARVGGLFLFAPILGSTMAPVRVRVALVFFVTVAMLPILPAQGAPFADGGGITTVCAGLARELGIGFVIGLVAQFIFGGAQMAGQLAGMQMGIGLANLFDPQTQAQITALAQWQNLIALLTFLAIDGHHLLIRAVAESFSLLPIGGGLPADQGMGMILVLAGGIFVIALKLAAPVLVLLLLVHGAMSVLAKMIPQLNVFIVGFPLNIAAGLLVLVAAQPFTMHVLENAFGEIGVSLDAAIRALR